MNTFRTLLVFSIALFLACETCQADEGHPIAIRHWPGGGFTIETMWDLSVGVGLTAETKKLLPKPTDYDVESLERDGSVTLQRLPNQSKVSVAVEETNDESDELDFWADDEVDDSNLISLNHLDSLGSFNMEADGIFVVGLNGMSQIEVRELINAIDSEGMIPAVVKEFGGIENWHVCVIATDDGFTDKFLAEIATVSKAEFVVVDSKFAAIGDVKVEKNEHNTLAISSSGKRKEATRFVSLGTKPYKMSDEVADLFAKKEAAQKTTRELFASLSVEQMNFKPSNGSHTPRWNAEHMMGRELVFFSQIYNAVDPSIPVMDLNPKQMPKDYEFAHPDWSGEEEARQLARVEKFTRRFAYLLDGMDLDTKAKGSRFWTPRKLLKQMERHYNEHSANVRKKMKLEDWPKSDSQSNEKE